MNNNFYKNLKHMKKILLVILVAITFAQCKKETTATPTAIATCTPTSIPLSFSFKGGKPGSLYRFTIEYGVMASGQEIYYSNLSSGFSTTINASGCKCSKTIEIPTYNLTIRNMNTTVRDSSLITGYIILNGIDTIAKETRPAFYFSCSSAGDCY